MGIALSAFFMVVFLLSGSYLVMFLSTLILIVSLTSLIISVIYLLTAAKKLKKQVENSGIQEEKFENKSGS
jgi:predicted tellurium resistance membrane protein TerC